MPAPTVTRVRGCCPLDCQDTCSWIAHVEGDRVVRVEGAKDHPFTRGTLCAKVNDYEQRVYAPDRILHPLVRVGPKGAGAFERISWNQALDRVAERLQATAAEHGAEAILPLNYMGSMGIVQRRALMRIFHALGASRFHGSICGASEGVVAREGHPQSFDPEDIVHSRFILLWGANPLSTSHHHWHFIDQARRANGARLVCVDPIKTRTASACDEHVMLRPGSDIALAAGIAHVSFSEGRIDEASARATVIDLDSYRRAVEPWTPERVASVSGVPAETVIRLAREFQAARPATIRCGISPQQTRFGEAFVRSLSALSLLGGHWRHRGGGLFILASPDLKEALAARPDLMPRQTRSLDLARLGEHLTSTSLAPRIHALAVWNHNPAVTHADSLRVRQGLAREDLFCVVLEHFLTDTARYADVVLPSTTQLEHFDIVGAWGHHYISMNEPAVRPQGEALSHGEIMRRLAPRLGLEHPAFSESDEEIAAIALPEGISLATLREKGWTKTTPRAPTPGNGAPHLSIAHEVLAPAPPPEGTLQLLTPKSHYFMNTSFANMPRQRGAMKRPTLEMNRGDAQARGLVDDQEVVIENPQASLRVWLKVTNDICPGVVSLPGKWWGDSAVNLLTPSSWSPGGQPAFNETFVRVSPVPS